MGSVSDGVLHHAGCPVLIVRGEPTGFSKVLLACDGSAGAFQATRAAGAIARGFGAQLEIIHVQERTGALDAAMGDEAEVRLLRAREILLTRIRGMAQNADCEYTIRQEVGHPAETIVRYARDNDYPLIVLGSRGLNPLKALALGSVSSRVAHHSHASVLIVR